MAGPIRAKQHKKHAANAQKSIVIKFFHVDGTNHKIKFRIIKDRPLGRYMRVASQKFRLRHNTVTFRHHGYNVAETDTCESLGIQNEDTIDMFNAHEGPKVIQVLPSVISDDRLLIKILRWDTRTYCYYDSLRNMPITFVMEVHRREWAHGSCAQRFSYDGRLIEENDTPASLGMRNWDTLDVFYAQEGGGSY